MQLKMRRHVNSFIIYIHHYNIVPNKQYSCQVCLSHGKYNRLHGNASHGTVAKSTTNLLLPQVQQNY